MKAYAIGQLFDVKMNVEVMEYLNRIEDTLSPFGGKFIIHGALPHVLEGAWDGDLIVIEFPDSQNARGWYDSKAYQHIAVLRTNNSTGNIFIIDGVPEGHKASEVFPSGGERGSV